MRIAYLSWLVLLGGVVSTLRASGRGRCRWEPVTIAMVAATSPVLMCVVEFFHPQDIVAMGFTLIGLACAWRDKWILAGVLMGLAYSSQPFVLLVATPVFILAPRRNRLSLTSGFIGSTALITGPLIIASSGRALRAAVLGSNVAGSTIVPPGGTGLWELHLHGLTLFLVSRIMPLGIAIVIAWRMKRGLGGAAMEPVPLLSMIAIALVLRLIFEVSLFGYYLMPVAVVLVVMDVVRGHIRATLIAWIGLATVAFNPVQWVIRANGAASGLAAYRALPIAALILGLGAFALFAARGLIRLYLIAWLGFIATAYWMGGWVRSPYGHPYPIWLWQIILVSAAAFLALQPLTSFARVILDREQIPLPSSHDA